MRGRLGLACAALATWVPLVIPATAHGQLPEGGINLKALFAAVGRMHDLDPQLLEAIADVESGRNPAAVSPKGAMGLMQLMPATASEFSVPDPFDPVSNVLGAANFIDYLRRRFANSIGSQSLPNLLAAYNAGPGAVEKYGGMPPYPETHQYVHRVIEKYTAALAARNELRNPAPMAKRASLPVLKPEPYARGLEPVLIKAGADGDRAVLDQLTEIRRLRGRLAASLALNGAGRARNPVAADSLARSAATPLEDGSRTPVVFPSSRARWSRGVN